MIVPNQTSCNSLEVGGYNNKKPVSYSAIKHGIIGLTKYLETYYVGSNFCCNSLSSDGVQTDQDIRCVEYIENFIPLGRMPSLPSMLEH